MTFKLPQLLRTLIVGQASPTVTFHAKWLRTNSFCSETLDRPHGVRQRLLRRAYTLAEKMVSLQLQSKPLAY